MATYSFLRTSTRPSAVPGGSFQLGSGSGNADEGISFDDADPKNTMTPGADGQVMHSLHASNAGKVVVRLLKTSPVNAQLSQLYANQKKRRARCGGRTSSPSTTWPAATWSRPGRWRSPSTPHAAYAKDGNVMEWEFDVGALDILLGTGSPEA
jgi:hypothetical protein